ncbi:F-box protein [Actinidia chinensis var. chinensis]|uniref:F-box protein n=1 Tax=Actinidia chinensis var. chinensis TaxID=1590841 RepID=A0A2R6P767_ACTCC|nr:F-box protein [Actinidia chinensis var. chinensis]
MNFDSLEQNVEHLGGAAMSAVHPDIIQTHILTRIDGPTLASAGCASSQLHSLSSSDGLWQRICHRTWPSTADPHLQRLISAFPAGHRTFYSDAFPCLNHPTPSHNCRPPASSAVVSAVDIRYHNKLILSKIHETETESGWFLCSPFRVDLLDPKETVPSSIKFQSGEDTCLSDLEDNLTLSWILIDPTRNRAANFSSLRPVSVNRHWLTSDVQVRYAKVLPGERRGELVVCAAVITCGRREGGELQLKEVSLHVEDMEGKNLSGRESSLILQDAMENGERRREKIGEEQERYAEYLKMKREMAERKQRRERRLDMVCIATGVTLFLVSMLVLLRRYS